ncbi:LPS assembly lipoprotein LptE [Mesorhizobium australicum]|uniref:LPS-assembly lipoprotein n=1 Tax=Mesorhizobium australicum TaxID=536018 RepID=A0A1X7PYP3_9HYPH|nr:LPS assembly lipoprotein LptE [Mesorhizobium australicum]SMH57301.1 LPS-assembly lipoprotein [Mesorhizobium australicum]
MSLHEMNRRRFSLGLVALAGLAVMSACTARPLYSDAGLQTGSLAGSAARPSIVVKPPTTRVGLEVRNHLVFLLTGGGAEPANPAYTLDPSVSSVSSNTATIQRTVDTEPTSGQVTVTASYKIIDNKTGEPVAAGRRSMVASYDIPRQEFAAVRALRDAENRAARELAETLRAAIAQDLARLPPAS